MVKFEDVFSESTIKVRRPIAHEPIRAIASILLDRILEMNRNDFISWMNKLYIINEDEVNVAVNDLMLRFQVLSGTNLTTDAFVQSYKLLPTYEYLKFNSHELILIGIGCYLFRCINIASSLLYCISNRNISTIKEKCHLFLPGR